MIKVFFCYRSFVHEKWAVITYCYVGWSVMNTKGFRFDSWERWQCHLALSNKFLERYRKNVLLLFDIRGLYLMWHWWRHFISANKNTKKYFFVFFSIFSTLFFINSSSGLGFWQSLSLVFFSSVVDLLATFSASNFLTLN